MLNGTGNNIQTSWDELGDIKVGRPNLGDMVSVLNYRALQYSIWHVFVHGDGQGICRQDPL